MFFNGNIKFNQDNNDRCSRPNITPIDILVVIGILIVS